VLASPASLINSTLLPLVVVTGAAATTVFVESLAPSPAFSASGAFNFYFSPPQDTKST
jgi:hypothetical protein